MRLALNCIAIVLLVAAGFQLIDSRVGDRHTARRLLGG
jgi:hypothetical protein